MRKLLTVLSILALVPFGTAAAEDCVDVELGAEIVAGGNLALFFSVENCGTEPGQATFDISLSKDSVPLGSAQAMASLPAGQEYTQQCELPIPPMTPAGQYTVCVTVTLGLATDSACATVTIDFAGNVIGFAPADGDPTTTEVSWGQMKNLYN